MNYNVLVGDLIRKERKRQKVTQERLAAHLGISRPSLVSIEQGGKQIRVATICSIALYLEITPDRLLPDLGIQPETALPEGFRGTPLLVYETEDGESA